MPHKFRFGVLYTGSSLEGWQSFARKAEDLGFSTLVVQDHVSPQLAPLLALVSAATVTTTLRLGTIVLNNDFRHPAVLAKEAAIVDVLTNGRLELGLGAGWAMPSSRRRSSFWRLWMPKSATCPNGCGRGTPELIRRSW